MTHVDVKDLGPHDLVYLVKSKSKGKSESRQVHKGRRDLDLTHSPQ